MASAALLLEEPYGEFGGVNPTGHSAIYLDHVCAAAPDRLRPCTPGELGVVISRYHKVGGYDWLAVPLIPYLYSVASLSEVPASVSPITAAQIRNTYRHNFLQGIVPDAPGGGIPPGEWTELVGEAFDRRIYVYQIDTTPEQDEHLIDRFNDRRNVAQYNMLDRNCADLTRGVFDMIYPRSVHRNIFADWGIMTPKQVARSLVSYGRKHPEIHLKIFVIPQVPGTLPRSHSVYGCAEGFVKSKKYVLPSVLLSPYLTAGMVVVYVVDGRFSIPKNPPPLPLTPTLSTPITASVAASFTPSITGSTAAPGAESFGFNSLRGSLFNSSVKPVQALAETN
jgi:hypothetical protein